ncbi:sulfurase [Abyssibius alkaniclasticus]|uniref:MOSC domain-containing protein n=1 Tax=Abyssibius alkaniclasticus TaxID=2881234 RepID=UPI0023632883|nr:sulfurase [Abyssibius alkaniclasticus]UPH71474.1 sulfurase [Abyssibius alkaniclasticus]
MPILSPTEIYGHVTFLGIVPDRTASLRSVSQPELVLDFAGARGECHSGVLRKSCSRVSSQYPVGTEIRNVRQLSLLSAEELAAIAAEMGLEQLLPEYLGASIVLRGIPNLTLLPPNSRLIADNGAAITVDMENGPCQFPAREIEADFPGKGAGFMPAARNKRGVTAWVERPGTLALGTRLRLHVPPLRAYPALADHYEKPAP